MGNLTERIGLTQPNERTVNDTLEFHFNPRVSVPNHGELQSARRIRSQWTLANDPDVERGITETDHPAHYIRYGRNPTNRVTLLFFHGGYWRAGSAGDNACILPAFKKLGWEVILMEYPLCPQVSLPQLINNVSINSAWVIGDIKPNGPDHRIVLGGISAGAHLAASLLASSDPVFDTVEAGLLLTGIFDLSPVPLISVNSEIRLKSEHVEQCSPAFNPPRRPMPLLFAYGSEEPALWRAQSDLYASQCRILGCSTTTHVIPGRNHFNVIEELEDGDSPVLRQISKLF